jgi:hypothetical protein
LNKSERQYIERVKNLPCACCDAPSPSDAHHIRTGQGASERASHYLTVALCKDCHQGTKGLHGDKTFMRIFKKNELDLLAITIERLQNDKGSN